MEYKNVTMAMSVQNKKIIISVCLIMIVLLTGIFIKSNHQDSKHVDEHSEIQIIAAHKSYPEVEDIIVQPPYHNGYQLIGKPNPHFSITNLNSRLYSNTYLKNYSDLRDDLIKYCSSHTLGNQTALINCNSAASVDNIWYQISEASSLIIKNAFTTSKAFTTTLIIVFLCTLLLNSMWQVIKILLNPLRIFVQKRKI